MTLTPPQRAAIREELLLALTNEGTANVRNKTSDAVAELARQYVEEGMLKYGHYNVNSC
jgi:hypothetical protein